MYGENVESDRLPSLENGLGSPVRMTYFHLIIFNVLMCKSSFEADFLI